MPPTSDILKTADAVVSVLNAASLSMPFTAVRTYLPAFELKDMDTLHVTVVPKGILEAREAKAAVQYDHSVDIAVQKRFPVGGGLLADIDPLQDLVEEIAELFRLSRLTPFVAAAWLRTEHLALFDPAHMEEFRQFTSVLTLTFRVLR